LLLALCATLFVRTSRAAEVNIPDPNLAQVIREKLEQKQIKKEKFDSEDLATIFILHANGREIKDLSGLEHCFNLAEVRLANNAISNVGPLAECKNIASLDLAQNQIQDITPLGQLTKLQYLNVEHNQIDSLAAVESLQALASLY